MKPMTRFVERNNKKYFIFEDGRRYQQRGLFHPDTAPEEFLEYQKNNPAPRYQLSDGTEFWFDGITARFTTKDPEFYLQLYQHSFQGESEFRFFVSVGGRRVQFSPTEDQIANGMADKTQDGVYVWKIDTIGDPLCVYVGFKHSLNGEKIEGDGEYQCLSNSSTFANKLDQNRALDLVQQCFGRYGNMFSADPYFGREKAGEVLFSDDIKEKLETGFYYGK